MTFYCMYFHGFEIFYHVWLKRPENKKAEDKMPQEKKAEERKPQEEAAKKPEDKEAEEELPDEKMGRRKIRGEGSKALQLGM